MESPHRPMVFVATPCYGGLVSQIYMQSVLGLVHFASVAGFDATLALLGHDSLVTRSRNTLVAQFLATPGATHLLFIDADIGFEAQQIGHMLRFDEDFVAGAYPLKVIDWNSAAMTRAGTSESFEAASFHYVGALCSGNALERKGRFATALYCGGGFMLLKRCAILRMIEAYPNTRYRAAHAYTNAGGDEAYALFDCLIDKDTQAYVSEDFGFCQKWRDIGGKIWLDTEGRLTHVGAHAFQGDPRARFAAVAKVAPQAPLLTGASGDISYM
jgi:hypothetical protein